MFEYEINSGCTLQCQYPTQITFDIFQISKCAIFNGVYIRMFESNSFKIFETFKGFCCN